MKNDKKGFSHLIDSTKYSLKGIKAAFQHESAFRQELIVCAVLFPLSFYLADSIVAWSILIIPLFTLLITELLNSGLESVVDRIGSEFHELAGRAKDLASAAVFINIVFLVIIWGAYLLYYFDLFFAKEIKGGLFDF